ncbi:MAG: hypothetical protein HQL83_08100, partial [Magnetococcales bacterium]|nr:hypothetical protein [Magnetococcales bacterium]
MTRRRLLHVSWILLALFSSTASGQPPGSDRKDALDLVDAVHEIVKKTADDAVATPGVNKSAPQPAPSPPPTASGLKRAISSATQRDSG